MSPDVSRRGFLALGAALPILGGASPQLGPEVPTNAAPDGGLNYLFESVSGRWVKAEDVRRGFEYVWLQWHDGDLVDLLFFRAGDFEPLENGNWSIEILECYFQKRSAVQAITGVLPPGSSPFTGCGDLPGDDICTISTPRGPQEGCVSGLLPAGVLSNEGYLGNFGFDWQHEHRLMVEELYRQRAMSDPLLARDQSRHVDYMRSTGSVFTPDQEARHQRIMRLRAEEAEFLRVEYAARQAVLIDLRERERITLLQARNSLPDKIEISEAGAQFTLGTPLPCP